MPRTTLARTYLCGSLLLAGCAHDAPPDAGAPPPTATPAATAATTATTATATPPAASSEKAAQSAADAWLALVDAGSYGQSWVDAASYFKKAVDQPGWQKAVGAVRGPLGKVLSRKLKSATYATSLPGAPDGEYVVIQLDTSFENKQSATETVTPMKDTDGSWRVSGYFIR